jgi:hypothetical protein
MILKGSQRGGPRQLANHLLKPENDHVTIMEMRGFVSDDLVGAMAEVEAIAKGTRCKQPVFSLSLSPPKSAEVTNEDLTSAIDRAESALGLTGRSRSVVIHEKNGRKHAHVVWSRIDENTMTAVNLPHYKLKLNSLSKELYLEHGWELPDGHKTNGWKNPLNFSLAEWQQAKRLDLDPREIKQVFQAAWQCSDNLASFRNALEANGYFLAQGDRRGFVAVGLQGEVYSVARATGVKSKDVRTRLGDSRLLPTVESVRQETQRRITEKLSSLISQERQKRRDELAPLRKAAQVMARYQRIERLSLQKKQDERLRDENQHRAGRFKRGLGAVLDLLTGRLFKLRKENEQEAFQGYLRDRAQREQLCSSQFKERAALQKPIDEIENRHRRERVDFARRMMGFIRERKQKLRGFDLEM